MFISLIDWHLYCQFFDNFTVIYLLFLSEITCKCILLLQHKLHASLLLQWYELHNNYMTFSKFLIYTIYSSIQQVCNGWLYFWNAPFNIIHDTFCWCIILIDYVIHRPIKELIFILLMLYRHVILDVWRWRILSFNVFKKRFEMIVT